MARKWAAISSKESKKWRLKRYVIKKIRHSSGFFQYCKNYFILPYK